MQLTNTIRTLCLLSSAHASRLFVSSYSGNIATVELTDKTNGVDLKATSLSQGCKSSPSWLQYDSRTSTLYCADEGNATPGQANLTSLKKEADGSLTFLDNAVTQNGGVSTAAYKVGKDRLMAVAHYGGSGISIINTTAPSALELLHAYTFTFDPPRTGADSKPAAPFIHQVVVDPTGSFLLAPNLSGDEVHIFGLNEDGMLTDNEGQAKLEFHAGSGPRHLAFYQPDGKKGKTYVYVVMEKMNMLHGFEVTYSKGTMQFRNVYMSTIFGGDESPAGSAAAEITVTPDNKFLIISSRMDKLNPPGPMNPNSPSDTLVTFSLDPTTGFPKLLQKFSAGGIGPRSFAINKAGDRVAIALATSNKLVILARDIKAGTFTSQLGSLDLDVGGDPSLVTSVVWEEESEEDTVVGGGKIEGGAGTSAVSGTAQVPMTGSSPSLSSSASSSGEKVTMTAPGSSTAGPNMPSAPSEEDVTIFTTMRTTSTVTKPACQAPDSPETPTPMTLTRTLSSITSANMFNPTGIPLSILPTGTESSTAMTPSQLTASTAVTLPTPTRFPTTTPNPESSMAAAPPSVSASAGIPSVNSQPGYFATMEPGSSINTNMNSNSNINKKYTGTSFHKAPTPTTATPSPVRTGIVAGCKQFYEVVKGDTCEGICEHLMVPKKLFWKWNKAVDEECKGLDVGEWVCVGV
ncbi:Lactonase, 7-bladed beta-propeller-domain-containing protein [Cadophora sp. MPI-SDFR-AT-0126]|nr:Lactonase, 7-bladed beta-propeller-domain-containing protein [Leotiomycetes sp. MPI-SDFR-AT-0126]